MYNCWTLINRNKDRSDSGYPKVYAKFVSEDLYLRLPKNRVDQTKKTNHKIATRHKDLR